MLRLACCVGRQQQNDNMIEDQSRKMHKNDQKDQLTNQALDQPFEVSSPSDRTGPENPDDPLKPRTELIDEIVEHLKLEDVSKVIIHGKQGVGKTWIAKEVAKQSILKNIFDVTIWVYGPELNLVEDLKNLSRQLSLQQEFDSTEYYFFDEDDNDNVNNVVYLINSRGLYMFPTRLKMKLRGRKCLLVLDDGNSTEMVERVSKLFESIIDSGRKNLSKILITRLEATDDTIDSSNDMITETSSGNEGNSDRRIVAVMIKPLTLSESKDLLQRTWIDNHNGVICDDDIEQIVKQCNYLPAAIVFTGNVLGYAFRNEPSELNKKLVITDAKKKGGEVNWALGYDKFINNATILKCFWLVTAYLVRRRLITYSELILYWILEGYFDETTSCGQGYAKAHNVLMDLLDAGILGERETGYIVLERAGVNFAKYLFPLLCEKLPQVALPYCKSFEYIDSEVNVKRLNGSIAAFERIKFVSIVALLVRGNSISNDDSFKLSMEDDPENEYYSALATSLKILYVSHVRLFLCLSGFSALKVLIIRKCYVNFRTLFIDSDLRILDLSECETLDEIPSNFLAYHNSLECLNLSGSPMKSIRRPALFLGLRKLQHLFLSFTLLESFPEVTGLEKLEVLDLTGAKFDSLKKKVWNLELPKLKMLDLSETCIYEFPGLVKLKNLTYLLLKNCPLLNKLRPVTTLTELQVIVASGCTELRFFREINIPSGNCLRKLDLSKTMIRKIPPLKNASNLVYLCLSGCHRLKELPPIEGAKNLRLLDASDAIQLEKIHTSFQDMKSLRELFLSNTKIKTLPSLSGLESLRKLILRGCESLLSIPENAGMLTNLLVLDILGCNSLETFLDEEFSHVTVLKS